MYCNQIIWAMPFKKKIMIWEKQFFKLFFTTESWQKCDVHKFFKSHKFESNAYVVSFPWRLLKIDIGPLNF